MYIHIVCKYNVCIYIYIYIYTYIHIHIYIYMIYNCFSARRKAYGPTANLYTKPMAT